MQLWQILVGGAVIAAAGAVAVPHIAAGPNPPSLDEAFTAYQQSYAGQPLVWEYLARLMQMDRDNTGLSTGDIDKVEKVVLAQRKERGTAAERKSRYEATFRHADRNSDGALTRREMADAVPTHEDVSYGVSKKIADHVYEQKRLNAINDFDRFDDDGDKALTIAEYVGGKQHSEMIYEDDNYSDEQMATLFTLARAFVAADPDHSGSLTKAEYKSLVLGIAARGQVGALAKRIEDEPTLR